jgi:pimeloyl-ACP methyl ester carboxylesterase
MADVCRVVLLPGLGTDERLLAPQRSALGELEVPPWIPPRAEEGLPEYAQRLAATVSCRHPAVLGGVSLGGMLACEMARHLRPQVVVLIASCRSGESVGRSLRLLHALVGPLPAWTIRGMQRLSALLAELTRGATAPQRKMCVEMFCDADVEFVRWALAAIVRWRPAPLEGVRVLAIHGAKDRLIPLRRVQADEIIPDGGHLINLTRPEQVNRFLDKALQIAGADGPAGPLPN